MTARPLLTVDTGNPTPPYEQLRRQLAELIQSAALAPGDRLPPVRQPSAPWPAPTASWNQPG